MKLVEKRQDKGDRTVHQWGDISKQTDDLCNEKKEDHHYLKKRVQKSALSNNTVWQCCQIVAVQCSSPSEDRRATSLG